MLKKKCELNASAWQKDSVEFWEGQQSLLQNESISHA